MKLLKFKVTYIEPLLGTSPANVDIYREYLATKAPTPEIAEEQTAILAASIDPDEAFSKALTIFPKLPDGTPFLYHYHWKGFFKEACSMLNRLSGKDEKGKKLPANHSSKMKAFKKEIDGNIFVFPVQIPIVLSGKIEINQRPLRADTPQGARVALSASEEIPVGSTQSFGVLCLNDAHVDAVMEWMGYGFLHGTGQWRNSGKGRFTYELLEVVTPKDYIEAAAMCEFS